MMKRYSILTILTLLAIFVASAQVNFTVQPPRNVIAGQRFQVVYRLSNAEGNSLKASPINGCTLLYGPSTSTSSSTQIINGNVSTSSSVDYVYLYRADKEGTYTIPAASIMVDGKKLTTDAVKFTVLPTDSKQNSGGAVVGDVNTQTSDKPVSKDDMFVRIILNKSTAYEQEAIECVLKLYTKYESITSFAQDKPASYDGFLIEEVQQPAELNNIEHFNGQNYRTAILKKCIIYPQKTGKLTISSGTYDVNFQQLERVNMGYFAYITQPVNRNIKLQPFTATVNVKPLPQPQPEGFDGAVGTFTVDSKLSSDALRTGEAASLTLTVKGTGNIKFLKKPVIDFPAEFEMYNPRQDFDTRISGSNMTGTMIVEYTFVPQSVGKFQIPATDFVYFSPADGKYTTLTTDSYEVSVAKGAGVIRGNDSQQDIKLKNNDILHIKLGDKHQVKNVVYLAGSAWYWIAYAILLLLFVAACVIIAGILRRRGDTAGRKHAMASKVARQRLSAAAKFMKAGDTKQFYEAVIRAILGYLSDKLAIPASALTRANITDELLKYGASAEQCDRVEKVLQNCEMSLYTPDAAPDAPQRTYQEAVDLMNELETVKKK